MLGLQSDDFRIKTENFDLTKSRNILRVACGLFFLPHIAGKFVGFAVNPAIAAFFAKAGFAPAEVWVLFAAAAETAASVCLILGVCTRFAALGAFALLLVTVYALQVVKGFGWTWNTGGYEYPVFWAIVAACVAIDAWRCRAVSAAEARLALQAA